MPGIKITLTIDGQDEFNRIFKRFDLVLTDLKLVWETVRDEFWRIEAEQFQSGGAAGASGKWAKLSKYTEAQKIAKYGSFALIAGPLHATEAMYKSLTRKTSDSIVDIQQNSISIGTQLFYASLHQKGSGKLPQRKIIDFSDKQKTQMTKAIQRTMLSELKKNKIPIAEGIVIL